MRQHTDWLDYIDQDRKRARENPVEVRKPSILLSLSAEELAVLISAALVWWRSKSSLATTAGARRFEVGYLARVHDSAIGLGERSDEDYMIGYGMAMGDEEKERERRYSGAEAYERSKR